MPSPMPRRLRVLHWTTPRRSPPSSSRHASAATASKPFRAVGRSDREAQESAELAVLEEYLPQLMGRDEVEAAARAIIAEMGASGPGDKGKVMGRLMGQLKGKADGGLVNATVTELLEA